MLWLGTLHGGPAISAIERAWSRRNGIGALTAPGRLRPAQGVGLSGLWFRSPRSVLHQRPDQPPDVGEVTIQRLLG